MKLHHSVAASILSLVSIAVPTYAQAATQVCGRVDAPSTFILALQQQTPPENIVIARSGSEEVRATVGVDGRFCFDNLHQDLHTIVAFNDAFPTYETTVTPIDGRSITVSLTGLR